MTHTTPPPAAPPAGWYPAPDGSQTNWWWDGASWMHPPQPPQSSKASPAVAGLALATQILVIACAAVSLVTVGTEALGISGASWALDGQAFAVDLLNMYDQSTIATTIVSMLTSLAAGVLWLIWQFRVAKYVDGTRRSAGWHIGSWFIPVVSFWFPYQNVSDLWRAVGRARPSWLIIWWLLFMGGNVVVGISGRIYYQAEDLELLRVAMWVSIAGELLLAAAAPLAVLVVRGITHGVLQGPADPAPAHSE
ncbi:DUF4328 domain-containing protein [Agromyces soli]